jgi:hypothetical protein
VRRGTEYGAVSPPAGFGRVLWSCLRSWELDGPIAAAAWSCAAGAVEDHWNYELLAVWTLERGVTTWYVFTPSTSRGPLLDSGCTVQTSSGFIRNFETTPQDAHIHYTYPSPLMCVSFLRNTIRSRWSVLLCEGHRLPGVRHTWHPRVNRPTSMDGPPGLSLNGSPRASQHWDRKRGVGSAHGGIIQNAPSDGHNACGFLTDRQCRPHCQCQAMPALPVDPWRIQQ